jgi:heme/copper-type cytochrome/quinol oxidase subunit 1
MLLNNIYYFHPAGYFQPIIKILGFYTFFGAVSGVLGTTMSIRMELAQPGNQILSNHQLYNVLTNSHAFFVIFYMVMPIVIGGLEIFLCL